VIVVVVGVEDEVVGDVEVGVVGVEAEVVEVNK
jgi:hypothetical protein